MSARECPVDGCENERDPAHVMCKSCWFTVPKAIRDDVWRTFRARGPWADESISARERAITVAEQALAEKAPV